MITLIISLLIASAIISTVCYHDTFLTHRDPIIERTNPYIFVWTLFLIIFVSSILILIFLDK